MAKYVYPAIFTPEAEGFSIRFPDVPGCYTQGRDLVEGLEMAKDALSLMLYSMEEDHEEIAPPSQMGDIALEENAFSTLISCDTLAYRKQLNNRAVKKTLTIPGWLNEIAVEANVNFSQILQEALKAELHVT